jgi:hypothetical protein
MEKDIVGVVPLRSVLSLFLLLGLLLVLHGRAEPDIHNHDDQSSTEIGTTEDPSPLHKETPGAGDHTDEHGCYHSHEPFTMVVVSFPALVFRSAMISYTVLPPVLISTVRILQPPRA